MKRTLKWLPAVAAGFLLAILERRHYHQDTGCGCITCPSWEVCR